MVDISDPDMDQTEAICIEAVKKDGHTLQFVINQTDALCSFAFAYFDRMPYSSFSIIYNGIKYPSPQLINRLLKLYPPYTQHTVDLLYKPNSVNALVCHAKWNTAQTSAKTVFLLV